MGIRKLNPVTPGTRHKVITDFDGITTRVPEKSLTSGTNKSGGRNHQAR
jgi:large subunit ribosomal protein L2